MKLRQILMLSVSGSLAFASAANASSSWSDRPAWASSDSAPASSKRKAAKFSEADSRGELAPFSPGSHNLSLDLGQVFLMGHLNSNYSDSIGGALHYTYGVSDMFAFDSSLGYSNHANGKYSQTTLLAGLRTNLAWYDKVIPYLTFGMGFYRPSEEVQLANNQFTTLSPLLFGLHLGPGVDLEVTRSLFFGTSLTFHSMFGTDQMTQAGAKQIGGTYTSFYLHAGMTF